MPPNGVQERVIQTIAISIRRLHTTAINDCGIY